MTKPTCQQVHDALVASIELRWKPLAEQDACLDDVPGCQLCKLFPGSGLFFRRVSDCAGCPLSLIGQCCITDSDENYNSAWGKFEMLKDTYLLHKRKKAAKNMIRQLQKCLDTFFPKGWDK